MSNVNYTADVTLREGIHVFGALAALGIGDSATWVSLVPAILAAAGQAFGGQAAVGDLTSGLANAAFYCGAAVGPVLGGLLVQQLGV